MEVDRISFAPRLLEMLEDMAKCSFMAIDFEFSGIATKLAHATGKQTVQERYRDTKEAAERYQILQIGLTFAIYDDDRHHYVLKPYNMNLNPLIDEKLDIERIFSFQSGAVEFLLRHGFSLEEPFKNGVPYLSRDEAAKAKEIAYNRLSKKNIEDIHFSSEDVEALAFMEGLRKTIDAWKGRGCNQGDELEIFSRIDVCEPQLNGANTTTNASHSPPTPRPGLNRFEKRLVHQLVRAEYPKLVTIGGRESIRIIPLDEEREAEVLRKRKHGVKEQINRQTGFRWIVEALLGNSLERIDVRSFAFDPHTGIPRYVDLRALQSRFDMACATIRRKKIPIVGHNMFTDLVYFYRTFIGALPDTAGGFAAEVNRLFPTIVDTKYLATHNCGDINPASSLQEIEEKLQMQERPVIETHQNHAKYVTEEAFHEAGYDSYLTALVAIRLSAKLENDGSYVQEAKERGKETQKIGNGLTSVIKSVMNGGVSLLAPSSHVTSTTASKPEGTQSKETTTAGRFSTANVFEQLGKLSLNKEGASPGSEDGWGSTADSGTSWEIPPPPPPPEPLPPMTQMPPLGSDFWTVYGNKLRLFGTVEGLLELGALD